jgi:5-methylcytosine-specific restriction protein A
VPASLHDTLESALATLPAALREPFSGHQLGDLLVRDAPEAIRGVVDDPGYKLQGSRGRGNWAETVWVSVFDRLVTETAQRGY